MNFRSFSTLQIALGVSVAVHAALLTVRFVDPQAFNRVFEDTPLEVILVNAKTSERPDKAKALAQTSMAGGGEAEKGRATSPLPPALVAKAGDDVEEQTRRELQNLQEQQSLMLAQIKRELAKLPPPKPHQANASPEQVEREERRRQLIKILAEIERRINEENARPKKRYVSPSTKEVAYAIYYDNLRRAIENRGTENFPEVGGKKIYGELTMLVTVNFDGRVLHTEIVQSSGNRTLDRRAEAISRSAGPFGNFSDEMRRKADQIVVVSRFRFTRDEVLETRLTAK
ncbi:energy transducer TonB [Rhodoferax sp. PAMC 29310]|uniref:energy transducer TonB n=1 Tax=Rhodoferax sp. PAMC 29310 TaxID=2822760 RepID=UPI001B342E32|nr:TonB family protein [Rhodoferax sp. PAMC 29310]